MLRKECVNKYENKQDCPYKDFNCEKHGICCEYIRYHKKDESLPFCLKNKIAHKNLKNSYF